MDERKDDSSTDAPVKDWHSDINNAEENSVPVTVNRAEEPQGQADFTPEPTTYNTAPVVTTAPAVLSISPLEVEPTASASRRFLLAYVTSIFSAFTLLAAGSWLGYVLFDQWLTPKKATSSFFFDLAPLYISLMSSMIIFGALYFVASQYAARQVARDGVSPDDWRVYRVVNAFFSGALLVVGASVLASFLYIPIAQLTLADEFEGYEIAIQLLGGVHVLLWIGLLIWQQRLTKRGKNVLLPTIVVLVLSALIVVLTAIFPIGSKTDERYDSRTASDLSSIESAITTYSSNNSGNLPASLSDLSFNETDGKVKSRLSNYTYTKKSTNYPTDSFNLENIQIGGEATTDNSSGTSLFDDYRSQSNSPYELCATFRTDTTKSDDSIISPLVGATYSSSSTSFTKHKTGKVCFDRN